MCPNHSSEELNVQDRENMDSANIFLTTYLIKNLWHNYVHNEIQNITLQTYKDLKGEARLASEHFADHLANILLAISFGFSISEYNSSILYREDFIQLSAIYKRLRCSSLFKKRAETLGEVESDFRDRTLRTILNYCSTWLICNNLTPLDLTIFRNEKSEFIFRINRNYINSEVVDEIHINMDSSDRKIIMENVRNSIGTKYRALLRNNEDKRLLASQLMTTFLSRIDKRFDFNTSIQDTGT